MNNGCICCTVRGDLIRILQGLMRRKGKFDGIIVETTGLADPAPVAQTFFVDEDVRRKTKLDAIVTVVDASHLLGEIDRAHEIKEQIAFADVIVINKCDLVLPAQILAIETAIRRINPYAKLHHAERCGVKLAEVLDRDAFNLDRILEVEPDFLDHFHDHDHDDDVTSLSLVSDRPLIAEKFLDWISDVIQRLGPDILRTKGVLAMRGDDDRFVVQGGAYADGGWAPAAWKDTEQRQSRLVFIGRNLPKDVLHEGFEACRA